MFRSPRRPSIVEKVSDGPSPFPWMAAALAFGVILDRYFDSLRTFESVEIAFASTVGGALLVRRERVSTTLLFLGLAALGAAWHHQRWSGIAVDDVSKIVLDDVQPIHFGGLIVEGFGFRPGFSADDRGFTRFVVETTWIDNDGHWEDASGRLIVNVGGDRSSLGAGTAIEGYGQIHRIEGPLNPGEFDDQGFLRASGIRARITVETPTGIRPSAELAQRGFSIRQRFEAKLGQVRAWSYRTLTRGLDAETADLAAALLLGRRERVDPEINDAFARTGTTHLLAISGLHLQVVALVFGTGLRRIGLPRRFSYAAVATCTLLYALLVGLSPSVVRSAAMTIAFSVCSLLSRRGTAANGLAAAAMLTLAINPAYLFDVGCQLSFLGVAAIIWVVQPCLLWLKTLRSDPLSKAVERFRTSGTKLRDARHTATESLVFSTILWVTAAPLVALRFHRMSPISILLNLPLIPLTSAALVTSGCVLIGSAIWEPLAIPFAWATHWLLEWTIWIVRWGEARPWGSWYVPEPDWRSVFSGYGVAILLWNANALQCRWATWRVSALALSAVVVVWPLSGLVWRGVDLPKAEVLAVGHGLAVVVETAPGHALLYDCGRMRDSGVGRKVIAPALWARGIHTIDALLISHADADHYNALPSLLERFVVKEVLVSKSFPATTDPAVRRLLQSIRERQVPVRVIASGTTWRSANGRFRFEVLHPDGDFASSFDNATSLVVDVESGSRHFLLTGDIEKEGLTHLISKPCPYPIDVILSPHHGAAAANGDGLYRWADPKRVIVSQRPPTGTDALARFGPRVLRTWKQGALRLVWKPEGIEIQSFVDPPIQSVE